MKFLDDSFLVHILRALDLTYVSLFYSVYPNLSCVCLLLLGFLPCVFALTRRPRCLDAFLARLFGFLFFFVFPRFHLLIYKIHQKMSWCFYSFTFFISFILLFFIIFGHTTLNLFLRALHSLIRSLSLLLLCLIYNNSWNWFFLLVLLLLLLRLIILFFLASTTHINMSLKL